MSAKGSYKKGKADKKMKLKIVYEVDGKVIRVIEKEITEKYKWFLIGNPSWRGY